MSKRYRAPGRINLIGEHTDYNEGFVLPAAIDKEMVFTIAENQSDTCIVHAQDLNEVHTFALKHLVPLNSGWQNYVMGVVHELQVLVPNAIKGCQIHFSGNVPLGSGVSSSAALECGLAFGLNDFFDLRLDRWQIAKACQKAEHHFVGMKCGIMDQFSSMMGKTDHAMLLDCRSLDFEYVPLDLGNVQLILLNTKIQHELASSAYNDRRASCEQGVKILQRSFPQISSLRDVNKEMLAQSHQALGEEIYQRCRHVIDENSRVIAAKEALQNGDLEKLGSLMFASHRSLSEDYEVSCPELDFLVNEASKHNKVLGARMMGGGFGGCTINLIHNSVASAFVETVERAYRDRFGIDLEMHEVKTADGASKC
ncbi:MAG: galactokinase [Saprospiraceae bacterium]|nr:galactokinase [Saprospiraceae bacterium]